MLPHFLAGLFEFLRIGFFDFWDEVKVRISGDNLLCSIIDHGEEGRRT